MKSKEFKLKCSKCNSSQTSIRIKTNEIVCHKCGFIEKIK
jgi:hypothetical protein